MTLTETGLKDRQFILIYCAVTNETVSKYWTKHFDRYKPIEDQYCFGY